MEPRVARSGIQGPQTMAGDWIMTSARRQLSWIVNRARRLDHEIWSGVGRRQVLVEARTPMNVAVLRPIIEPLLRDTRLNVRVTAIDRQAIEAVCSAMRTPLVFMPRAQAKWARWDLYLNADPWEALRPRRAWRQINFSHGVAGKYDLDCPADLPIEFSRYTRVAFPNESRLLQYVRAGLVTEQQAALIGFPKVDALLQDTRPAREVAAEIGLDPSRPTVIYAPTFSPASSLHDAGESIIATLLAAGWNTIVKLHDRSLSRDIRYTAGIDWRERLSTFQTNPAFLLAKGGDSTPYVLASDAMVTDHSSIGFEFCVLNRPLIVYDAPRLAAHARINPERIALLRSAATVVSDVAQLSAALRTAGDTPRAGDAERRRVANEIFYRPGTATARALRLVYDLLGLVPVTNEVSQATRAWRTVE
jgi:CDP-glycerol:poly(glycerophosphate) glycerophosphotransferase